MLTVLIDGVASGMLLCVPACGLSATPGLMDVVNLAHGAFGMAGGYLCAVLLNQRGVPFSPAVVSAALFAAAPGLVPERRLDWQLYGRDQLDQVLFSIGLVFVMSAVVDWFMGARQQLVTLPAWLQGRSEFGFTTLVVYRAVLIAVCGAIALAPHLGLLRRRFGARRWMTRRWRAGSASRRRGSSG